MTKFKDNLKEGLACLIILFFVLGVISLFTPAYADTIPVDNGNVLSGWYFEVRTNPVTGKRIYHHALDFPAPKYTPIVSILSGEVTVADYNEIRGNYIEIADSPTSFYRYCHLQNYRVFVGDNVAEGTVFATVGNTGRSYGPHLHVERWVNGRCVFFTDSFGVKFKILPQKLQ